MAESLSVAARFVGFDLAAALEAALLRVFAFDISGTNFVGRLSASLSKHKNVRGNQREHVADLLRHLRYSPWNRLQYHHRKGRLQSQNRSDLYQYPWERVWTQQKQCEMWEQYPFESVGAVEPF